MKRVYNFSAGPACLPEEVCRVVTGDAAVAAALTLVIIHPLRLAVERTGLRR